MLMGDIQHVKRRRKVFRVLATCLPKKKPLQPGRAGRGKASMRYRKAMSS